MTEKLYYQNSHLYEFNATVIKTVEKNGKTCVVLDKTAFFPGGGGQPCDEGTIGDVKVESVFEENGEIYHILASSPFSVGDELTCKLDAQLRFARMQAHSGEHIVSGIAHKLYGVENVGFHMDNLVMTVDFDKLLTKEELSQVERQANMCVYSNVPIHSQVFSVDEAQKISYRSKLDFTDDVRIVEIEGVDRCACCAVHVDFTGEIGLIKILSSASHRGGVRLTLICGIEAYFDYADKYRQTLNIASMLCAKHGETDIAVKRLLDTEKELNGKIVVEKSRFLDFVANSVTESEVVCEFFDSLEMSELRELTLKLKDKCKIAVILLSGNENGYSYCIYSEKPYLSQIVKEFNAAFSGSGGGRPPLAQGKCKGSKDTVVEFAEKLRLKEYENA